MRFIFAQTILVLAFASGATAGTAVKTDASENRRCVIAFPDNDHSARVRARAALAERIDQPMTFELARKALELDEMVRVSTRTSVLDAHEGNVIAFGRDSFSLVTREGMRIEIPYSGTQFYGATSMATREARLEELKKFEPIEVQKRIEQALEAQRNGQTVEIRVPIEAGDRRMVFIYEGQIRLLDWMEDWNANQTMKWRDEISIWLKDPKQKILWISGHGGAPALEVPLILAPASVRSKFPLTGEFAVKAEDFRILPSVPQL